MPPAPNGAGPPIDPFARSVVDPSQQQQHAFPPHHYPPQPIHPSLLTPHSTASTPTDYYSPATTSYLPTPPLASGHPGIAPHHVSPHAQGLPNSLDWPVAGPSNTRRASLAAPGARSPMDSPDPGSRRASDVVVQRRGSEAFLRRGSDALTKADVQAHMQARRASEAFSTNSPARTPLSGTPEEDDGRVGVEDPCSERAYTELKVLGDGSFGTVWLCDWHSTVKPNVLLSAMQCGAGARPEWAGKRLVALKRMKRVWEGGWHEARSLGELVSLRTIPPHPAVIPLYDAFISPRSRELYFVFECMEGNLYQLTKSRKGRPLAAGLIASCFHQIVSGLHHIHNYGYFHRDMKPENLLVTTTGLCDYLSIKALNEINAHRAAGHSDDTLPPFVERGYVEKDVQVIVKLADFGLARAITSKPPYTEYVSTRWYRAPEVLLRSTEYGAPVDMWALGTILAEMINLKPIFPGTTEVDQVWRICDQLGDPSSDYGVDERGHVIGGGRWGTGIKLAKKLNFSFPKRQPARLRSLFPENTPQSLIDCIAELLRYNPKYRLTSAQCINHPYAIETIPLLQHVPPLPCIPFSQGQPSAQPARPPTADLSVPPRQLPPSHSHHDRQQQRQAFVNGDMRTLPPVEAHHNATHGGLGHNRSHSHSRSQSHSHTPEAAMQPNGGHPQPQQQTQQQHYFPSAPPLLRQDSTDSRSAYGTSALVHQLRELDLPTDDLASYGPRRWAEEQASRRPSLVVNTQGHDPNRRPSLAVSVHSAGASSSPSYTSLSATLSATHLQQRMPSEYAPNQYTPSPHVMAYVQQQQQQQQAHQRQAMVTQSTPNLSTPLQQPDVAMHRAAQSSMALTAHQAAPTPQQISASKMGSIGKKKKWGLSSVFGGGDKKDGASPLPAVAEGPHSTMSSLKRTQSGHYAGDRAIPAAEMDPKAAKKEAGRQARELAKAKREAAERAQKERARAVLEKRSQLLTAKGTESLAELEFRNPHAPVPSSPRTMLPPKQHTRYPSDLRTYRGGPATSAQSLSSMHSQNSSGYLDPAGEYYNDGGDSGRNKARKTNEEADHSSVGRTSMKSRSLLSIGTVDSDPGPRRLRDVGPDGSHQGRRTASIASTQRHPSKMAHSTSSLMTHSTASLESQLASQLARQATVASASESSLSLGRRAGRNLTPVLDQHYRAEQGPYGQHLHAGMPDPIRRGSVLPSIGDWANEGQEINPMFRVPPQAPVHGQQSHPQHHSPSHLPPQGHHSHSQSHTALPPFSAIASVADSAPHHHGHRPNQ